MSSVYLGTTPLKISTEIAFDPKTGYTSHETYAGPVQSLLTLKATYEALGLSTQIRQQGGKSYLEIILPVSDQANDYFELETEYVQDSIWNNEVIQVLADQLQPSDFEDQVARWRRNCEGAMKGQTLDINGTETDKTNGPLDFRSSAYQNFDQFNKAIYRLVVRGGEAYETTRQVLTRVRTISNAYSPKAVAQVRPIIYTTPQLVQVFGIPQHIELRLPADPTDAKPKHTIWAWKQRHNTSRYEWSGLVQEVMSWTFSTWSILTHFLHPNIVQPPGPD